MIESPGRSMRVVAMAGGSETRLEVRPRPRPRPGQVLLRLRASGLCGTDLWKLAGGTAATGSVLGHEVVGSVEEMGAGVEGIEPGERLVVAHHVPCGECALCARGNGPLCPAFRENLLEPGGFSEEVLVLARAVRSAAFKVPADIPDEAAVFLEPAACVLRSIRRAELPASPAKGAAPAAVIIGAGSMGLLHLLVLRAAFPAVKVLVSDPLPERLRLAGRLGADAATVPGEATAAVRDLTGGLGADAAFDTVGGPGPLAAAIESTREGGTVALFAHSAPGERAAFDLNRFFKSERRLVGSYSSTPEEQREIHRLIVERRLDASPLVTHRLPLSRFAEAVELCRARRALKVLLLPEGGPS